MGYMAEEIHVLNMLNIRGASKNLSSLSPSEKSIFLRQYSGYVHWTSNELNVFYSRYNKNQVVLSHAIDSLVVMYASRIERLFAPKFYHDSSSKNFLKTLKYVGKSVIDKINFCEFPQELGRQFYIYENSSAAPRNQSFKIVDLGWPMPDTYFRTIGATVRGFSFLFKNSSQTTKDNFVPATNLLNIENGTEEIANIITSAVFFPQEKETKEKIAEYNAVPIKQFINKSYFLYDKSNIIKEPFITAINKTISIYGSFSYFQGKTEEEQIRLLSAGNFLKFLVYKNNLKDELKFQLTNITGEVSKTKDKKIHNFLITRLGNKRKLSMQKLIETIIVLAQQNFDIAGGLNPIQIGLEDDRILNALKRYKNVNYKVTPLGLLFPASVKNDMRQIFITNKGLNGVKKSTIIW